MSADDSLGTSRSMQFEVELKDTYCKPVCHGLRRYSKIKTEFIDAEVRKMQKLGVVEDSLGEW